MKCLKIWKSYWTKFLIKSRVPSPKSRVKCRGYKQALFLSTRDKRSLFLLIVRRLLKGIIVFYRWSLSPLLGGQCRFYPTCSEYAFQCLDYYHPFQACLMIFKRVLKCHPFHPGGDDPVLKKQSRVSSPVPRARNEQACLDTGLWTRDSGRIS